MDEIVTQIRRVSDLIAEIRSAVEEQSSGVSQIDQAVSDLDNITQQNAALVEQSTAAQIVSGSRRRGLLGCERLSLTPTLRNQADVAFAGKLGDRAGQSRVPRAHTRHPWGLATTRLTDADVLCQRPVACARRHDKAVSSNQTESTRS